MSFHYYASFKGTKQGQLKGETIKAVRSDKWVELSSFEMGSEVPVDPKSGRPTGSRTHAPVVITKEWGGASPQLLDAHWRAELFDEVVIEIVGRPDTGKGETVVERITLTNAIIQVARLYIGRSLVSRKELSEFGLTFQRFQVENMRGRK
jgi:type VI secretion system secreted protein Hcp